VNITEGALRLDGEPSVRPWWTFPRIAELAESMVHRALDAFAKRDAELARQVLLADDEWTACATESTRVTPVHAGGGTTINRSVALDVRGAQPGADCRSRHQRRRDVLFLVKGIDVRHHAETGSRGDWANWISVSALWAQLGL